MERGASNRRVRISISFSIPLHYFQARDWRDIFDGYALEPRT